MIFVDDKLIVIPVYILFRFETNVMASSKPGDRVTEVDWGGERWRGPG